MRRERWSVRVAWGLVRGWEGRGGHEQAASMKCLRGKPTPKRREGSGIEKIDNIVGKMDKKNNESTSPSLS